VCAVRQTKEGKRNNASPSEVSSRGHCYSVLSCFLSSPIPTPYLFANSLLIDTSSRNSPFLSPTHQCLRSHNHMKSYLTSRTIHTISQPSSSCGSMAGTLAQLFCYTLEKASHWFSKQVLYTNMLSNHIPRLPTSGAFSGHVCPSTTRVSCVWRIVHEAGEIFSAKYHIYLLGGHQRGLLFGDPQVHPLVVSLLTEYGGTIGSIFGMML
jgi:hypothetical protein